MKTQKIDQIKFLLLLSLCIGKSFFLSAGINQQPNFVYNGALSMYQIFKFQADLSGGIKGNVDPSYGLGSVTIEVWTNIIGAKGNFPNILIYKLTNNNLNPNSYGGTPETIANPSTLGVIGNTYPKPWITNDIISSSLMAKQYYCTSELPKEVFNDLTGSTIPVLIKVYVVGGSFLSAKLPGIGEFTPDDNGKAKLKFDPLHPCNQGTATTSIKNEWISLKTVPANVTGKTVDLFYAAHRGFWGDDLGRGPVENTDPSIQASLPYTNIIESDISITKDKVVVVSHDYNLQRLTNYNGPNPDNTFIYDLNYNEIKDLKLRKRNFDVTDFKFIQLEDLISYMVKYNTVLTIDIKERARRRNPINGQCTAACDVDRAKRDEGWVEIFGKILEVAERKNAWQYLAIKTPLTINRIKQLLPVEKYANMAKVLYFPVIQPGSTVENAVAFINDWYNNAPNYLMGFETNFKTDQDIVLKPFSLNGQTYTNILNYVVAQTGIRPGLYPEEPMGPKGIVDRYAQWLFKDLRTDYRGDPFFLMTIPYFPISILTTDRPDIWQNVEKLYK